MADPVRYFFDQHVPFAIAVGLRRRGIDVRTAQDAGRCGFSDPDQLAFATADGRVVFTLDVDFIVLHGTGVPHAGIAWADDGKYTIGQLVNMLTLLHGVYAADDMRNHLEYL